MTEMIPTGEQLKPDNLSDAIKTYPIKDTGDTSPAQQDDQALKDEGPKQNNKLFAAWNFAKKNFDNVPDNIRDFQDDLSTPAKLRVLKKGMSKNFDNLPDDATFANQLGVSSSYMSQAKDALSNLEKNWKTLDLPVQQDNGKKVYNTETMGYDNALPTKEQLQSQINYSDAIKTYPIVNQENSADVLKNNKPLIQGFMNHFALLRPQDREAVLGSVDAMNIPQETKDFLKDEAPRLVDQRNEELAQIAKDTGEVSYNGFWKNISHDLHKAAQGFENSLLGVGLMPTIHKILNPFSVDLSQEMMSRLNNFSQYQIDPRDEADIASQLSGKPKSAGLELQEGISNQVAPITEMAITAALLPQMPLPRVIEGAGAAAKIMNLAAAYAEHGLKFGLPMQEAAMLFHGQADTKPLMEGLLFGSATKMTHSLINGALIDKLTSTGVPTRVARAFIEATSTALGGTAAATGIAAANGETVDGKFIRDQVVTLGALGMWGGVMGNASRKNFISGVVKDLADRGDISQAWVEPLIESAIKNTDPGTIKKTIQDYKVAVDKLKIAMHYVADDPNHPLNESVRKVLDGNDLSYDQYKDLTTIVDQTTTRYETAQARERADKFEKQSNSKLASDTEDLGASSDDIIKQIKDETGIGGGSSKTTPIENTIARISDIENGRPLNVTGGYRDENGELVLKLSSPHTNSEYEVFANSKNLQLRKVKDNGAETKQSESGDILKGDKIDAASKEIEEVQGENRQAEQGGIELSEHDRTVGSTLEEPNPIDELAGRMNKYPDIRSRLEDVISGKFDLETKNWAREVIKRADELKQEEKEYVARQEAKRESKYRAIEENLKKDADFANNQRFQTPTSLDVHKDIAKELTGDEVDYLRSIARGNEDARRILDEYDKINGDKEKLKDAKLDELADKNKDNPDMISAYERLAKSGSKDAQTVLDKIKKLNEGKDDVIQQIESFGVPKDQVEPVHNVISQQAEGKEQTLRAEGKETLPYKSERELASERGNQGDIVTGGNTPLGRLTEKVKGAPPRKFFDNMKEYFKNEWKALPTESSFKDVIDLAKSNINTFVKFSIERMRGLDKYGTWEQLIGERQYQQQLANSDQYDFVKNTLSRFTHDEMEPIGSYIQAGGDAESLGRSFQKTGLRKYKDAMNLTQEQKDMADHVSKMFDEQFDYLSKNDVLKSHLENYIRRSYEKNPDIVKNFSAELNSSIYTGKPGFSKKRVFEMDSDAEAEGMKLKPFLTRIVEYNYDAIKAVSDRAFVKGLNDRLEADGRPTVDIGGVDQPLYELQFDANDLASMEKTATFIHPKWRPSDTNPLNDRSDYVRYEHPSFRAFKYLMKDADGKPVFYQGDMLVHKDAIKRIRNLFDASPFETSPILKGVLHTMGVMKETMLDLSGFHAVQIGVHAAEHRVNPFAKHAFDLKNDKELIELVKHGMVLFDTRKQGLFQDGWSGASLVRKIPFLRTVSQTMGDFTFKEYIPRIKTAMAKDALERNRSRYPSLSEDQLYSLTAKQANAAFGGQNYEMMGRSKMWQDFSRILIAPDFFESRVKFVGQALTGFGGEQRTALMLGAVGMYVTARAINGALNDGDMHTEPENMFSVVYKGRAYSLRTIQGDLAHLYNDPSSFMFSRIHPLFSATGQKLLNRDPYGRKVTYEDMIRKMVPIPTGLSGLTEPEKTIYESFFRSFGITNKRWNEIDEVNRFAKKFKEDNGIKEKGEFIYDPDADRFRNFKVALRYGNDHDVEDAIKDGVKSGVFKEYELFTLMSRMKNSHFTDGKLEPKFLKSLDSEQRLKYNEALLEKQYLFNRFRKIINKE